MIDIGKKIIEIVLYFIFIISLLFLIFDSDEYNEKYSEKKEKELRNKEIECMNKSMYPSRMDCEDLLNPTCHVVCFPYPQK